MTGTHPEICLPEHKYCQQHNHSRYAVICTEYFTEQCNHSDAECHNKIDFKIIDQNMSAFFFFVCCVFDQLF
jgi:hypothetical protein